MIPSISGLGVARPAVIGVEGWLQQEEKAIAEKNTEVKGGVSPELDSMGMLPADVTV